MRIVNIDTFIKLPAGIIFAKYEPFIFGDLMIKGDTYNKDFSSVTLLEVKASSMDEMIDILESAETGSSFKLDLEYYCRDGLFEKDQLFAVYEKEDVEQLLETIYRCLKIAYIDKAIDNIKE